ncbi:histidine kinase [Streptomyces sp. NPDC047108]|uniref:sensor histidine kinase n=1 Tax=Streptomyces sp. NPDC047108 TaxID=3155025 RepID=UPI0033D82C77
MGQRWTGWPLAGVVLALVLTYSALFSAAWLGAETALIAAAACVAVALRRRRPVAVLVVTVVASLAYAALVDGTVFPAAITVMVALYEVGLRCALRMSVALTAATVAAMYFSATLIPDIERFRLDNGIQLGWFVAASAVGLAMRNQRRYAQAMEERALRAERTREVEARHRVDEERLRIAQELHDVVGHSIAVINVQSGVAAHVLATDPQAGQDALLRINRASATALSEIRSTLRLLEDVQDAAPHHQDLGLADLGRLVEETRAGGLPAVYEVTGAPRDVPSVVGFSVYRLVQESLTNIIKHAGAVQRVRVRLIYAPDSLRAEITDDGAGPRPAGAEPVPGPEAGSAARNGNGNGGGNGMGGGNGDGTGRGLAGMRQRIEAVGGRLEAGPGADGGFRVAADIPVDPA